MLKALIVDSAGEFSEKLEQVLTTAGFEVDHAHSGSEGLERAKLVRYRLVCCADNLKDFASSEFSSQLRSVDGYDYATLLILTAQDNAKVLKQALLAGATDIFSPHDLDEMEVYLTRLTERETRVLSGRVLFIEDSRVLQTIIIDLLTDMGLDVDAYNYAESAWEAFQAGDYDLVITDIMLEGIMSGISLVRKIRRMHSEYGNVPIIATSGFDNISRKIELFHLGVNDYVSKPIVREELRQRVFNHITSYQTIRELKSQQQSLYSLAMLDEVSGLFNRHALREFAGKYFSEAHRYGRQLSLAVLDIDHMREINEKYGYEVGDSVLAELGMWLKRQIRDIDLIARWAGDELVFILPGCDLALANGLMDRMLDKLRKYRPGGLAITVSVGIAEVEFNGHKETLNSLFERADKAMYEAKMAGRDCIVTYQETIVVDESES
jgi:two-component system cell cycle response regulator